MPRPKLLIYLAVPFLVLSVALAAASPGTKTITFTDLMKFRAIERPTLSEDGTVAAYGLQPDRGDGEGVVHGLAAGSTVRVPRGSAPVIAKNSRWVAMTVKPPAASAASTGRDRPRNGLALVEVPTGQVTVIERVDRFSFSDDGRWLAYLMAPADAKPGGGSSETAKPAGGGAEAARQAGGDAARRDDRRPGATLKLRDLASGTDQEIARVASFSFDALSKHLVVVVSGDEGKGNGVFVRVLAEPSTPPIAAAQADKARYESVTWTRDGSRFAFLTAVEQPAGGATLSVWEAATRQTTPLSASDRAPKGWMLPFTNDLTWSRDGRRLFIGLKVADATPPKASNAGSTKKDPDPYDVEDLLSKAEVDVWHWNDPRIQSQQKQQWNREKDRTYRAVVHLASRALVPLATLDMPDVAVVDNPRVALGTSDVPYARSTTWDERHRDIYLVDLETGARRQAIVKLRDQASLSPDGRFVAFFEKTQWHLLDVATLAVRPLTASLGVKFFDEEHDTPSTPSSYGLGGWVDEGAGVLIYDHYDIWRVPTAGGAPVNLTAQEGRRREITFRVVTLDPDTRWLSSKEPLLLTAYHNREKNWGFYAASFSKPGVELRVDEKKLFRFVGKARKADAMLYTREDFGEFPDVWLTDSTFKQPRRVSEANPQLAEFAWGSAELVSYTNQDGVPLQGVLIKPANYQPGKRYPVITYFYERQSQRLYEFNQTVVNHRPSFAVYAGAGYAIFLPDVVFTIGMPGQSMVKCLVPGVQKLVDMGIADPKALGLHGHSWGGYGTAYVITQTDMFAAAVTGAPVANMTSAYSGIRWESGVARQFQYEQQQSRIGATLWERRDLYIDNSAVFFADRIKTPVLIEHGDEDGAVPWYQAIEFYLALRRLGKDCIFLQYRGEPHHLQKYPNKLDYSIKMKQYFDHYLKGEPAADWITKGVPYRGK